MSFAKIFTSEGIAVLMLPSVTTITLDLTRDQWEPLKRLKPA